LSFFWAGVGAVPTGASSCVEPWQSCQPKKPRNKSSSTEIGGIFSDRTSIVEEKRLSGTRGPAGGGRVAVMWHKALHVRGMPSQVSERADMAPDPTHAKPCTWPGGWQHNMAPKGRPNSDERNKQNGDQMSQAIRGSTSSVRSRSPDGKVGRSLRCRCSRVRGRAVVCCDRSVERGSNQGTPSFEPGMDRRQLVRFQKHGPSYLLPPSAHPAQRFL
jgi:hypothetical protein